MRAKTLGAFSNSNWTQNVTEIGQDKARYNRVRACRCHQPEKLTEVSKPSIHIQIL